jgi:hypothetical protein
MYLSHKILFIALAFITAACDGAKPTPPRTPPPEPPKEMPAEPPKEIDDTAITEATTHLLLIDAQEPSYTVYYKIPIKDLEKVKGEGKGKDPALFRIIAYEHYIKSRERADHYTKPYIKINDYPEVDTIKGLSELLDRYPDTPFGLTWNGGIAYTYNDYQHVKRTYEAYVAAPSSHQRRERRADPVHPLNHIGPLLGR